jgi:hypothetical protein
MHNARWRHRTRSGRTLRVRWNPHEADSGFAVSVAGVLIELQRVGPWRKDYMDILAHVKGWVQRILTPRRSVAALIVAPVATALGTFLTGAGVVFCTGIHPDATTNAIVRGALYSVLLVFLAAAPIFAVLTVVLLVLLMGQLIKVVYRRLRGKRRTDDKLGGHSNEDAPPDSVIPMRRRVANT